ncbi:MAG TPA: ribosome maturation factor RimM [Candidatus Limnocylindria bacterium]|nr:ribosome maturation factor RimM [Candidatus Limnocylindria bacterium]
MGATSSSRSSPTPTDRLAVARIIGPKGLEGAVRLELVTDWPEEQIVVGAALWLDGETEPMRVTRVERGGRVLVVHLDGLVSREAAEAMVGRYLEAPAPSLPADTYFWHDLIGLRVEDERGAVIGELVEIFRAGGNEVYRVIGPDGERLVPALRSAIRDIDLDGGRMVLAPDDAEEVR